MSESAHPKFDAFKERVLEHPEARAAYEAAERRHVRRHRARQVVCLLLILVGMNLFIGAITWGTLLGDAGGASFWQSIVLLNGMLAGGGCIAGGVLGWRR